jgi:Fur family transcriptional regulator, peroxide stress response regulator
VTERKNNGFKMTPQRLAILRYLEDNRQHPSAADIYHAVSKDFPTMSLATVYNTLKALMGLKNVKEISIDSEKGRFDPDPRDHSHIICVKCRKIVDIQGDFSPTIPEAEKHGFEITGSHVDFYGLCPSCGHRTRGSRV